MQRVGKKIGDHSFRKKDRAVNMDTKSSIKVRDGEIQINTQLLFQEIVTAGTRTDDLPIVFKHELCPYPSALFKNSSTMLGTEKASLGEGPWSPE